MVESIKDKDRTGVGKSAAPRNVLEDNFPTVGVPYGSLEFDRATNAGALGFGAARVVTLKHFDHSTNETVESTKKIVPKAIRTG